MKFIFIDDILEETDDRIVLIKQVSLAEEYLADHFPSFPVLPGVLMIETMVQGARKLLESRGKSRYVLGEVKALKFGSMVRPGEALEMQVTLNKELEDGSYSFKASGKVCRRLQPNGGDKATSLVPNETAVSGRFTMRAIRRQ